MAISQTIIGKTTLGDGRILEFGARDPETGQRFERIVAPGTAPIPAPLVPSAPAPTPGLITVGTTQIPAPGVTTSPVQPQIAQFPNLAPTAPNQAVLDIKTKIDAVLGQIKTKQAELEKAKAFEAGLGKTGGEIPPGVIEPGVSEEEAQREGRIKGLEAEVFAPTAKTWQEVFKQAYADAGLEATKTKIDTIDAQINKARDDLVNEEMRLQEDPWLTSTALTGRTRTLYEMAERRISNLIAQRAQIEGTYTEGVRQAKEIATKTLEQEAMGRQLNFKELKYLRYLQKTEGTPQLKQLSSGEYAWMYPSGKVIKTGELAEQVSDLLSISEAKAFGLPYGTTRQQAIGLKPIEAPEELSYKQKVDLEVKLANDFEKY